MYGMDFVSDDPGKEKGKRVTDFLMDEKWTTLATGVYHVKQKSTIKEFNAKFPPNLQRLMVQGNHNSLPQTSQSRKRIYLLPHDQVILLLVTDSSGAIRVYFTQSHFMPCRETWYQHSGQINIFELLSCDQLQNPFFNILNYSQNVRGQSRQQALIRTYLKISQQTPVKLLESYHVMSVTSRKNRFLKEMKFYLQFHH